MMFSERRAKRDYQWLFTPFVMTLACCGGQSAFALDLLYTFEGDSGTTVTDKLTDDGAQDGEIFGNVFPDDTQVQIFGAQSAFFDLPDPVDPVPLYSTLEIPDTMFSDNYSLTLAAHFRNDEDPLDFTRLFSSYRGTGAVGVDRLLLDFDRREAGDGGQIRGLRAIINNTVVQPANVPAAISAINPGEYHHFAMTIDAGIVKTYFDGAEVLSGDVGLGYSNSFNVFLGEDPHDGGGSANEQLLGNIDEFLLIERALPAVDIAQLAGGTAVSTVVTPQASERAVYYDFEGETITDKFALDGAQNPIIALQVSQVSGAGDAVLGAGAANFSEPMPVDPSPPFSQINVGPVGNLGSQFTMSATINTLNDGGLTRIFSTFPGGGSPAGRLILDFNTLADVSDIGIRLILPDGTTAVTLSAPAAFENQTITAVYDEGDVKVYLNGAEVATATATGDFADADFNEDGSVNDVDLSAWENNYSLTGGAAKADGDATGDGNVFGNDFLQWQVDVGSVGGGVDLGEFDLRIGEDLAGAVNENFLGNMDDVLILGQALTPAQVLTLHNSGADVLLGSLGSAAGAAQSANVPEPSAVALALAGLLSVCGRCSKRSS